MADEQNEQGQAQGSDITNMNMEELAKQQLMQGMMDDMDKDDLFKLAMVSNDENVDTAAMLAMLND